MTTTATPVPTHRLPGSCFVCGQAAQADGSRPACPHDLTNAEADGAARAYDARMTFGYASGATTPEAAYVDETRGR